MASIAVTNEIGVIFVEPHFPFWRDFFVSAADALAQDPFPGFVLRHDISKPSALRSRILRVSVVVIKAGTVTQHQIAFDLLETERSIFVELIVSRFVRILHQRLRAEPARIHVRIFQIVIPLQQRTVLGVAPDKFDRFSHYIDGVDPVYGNTVFRFDTKNPLHATKRCARVENQIK